MDAQRFQALVTRLEATSARAPGLYKAKVAALVVLGFVILALFFGTVGFALVLLVGIAAAAAFSGGAALLVLLKLGKLLFFLVVPFWYLLKAGTQALFVRLPRPEGHGLTRADAPALFDALDDLRRRMRGPRFHHVLIVNDVNAAVVQRPAFGLIGWPRNYLLLGLPLLEAMAPEEAMAVVAHEYGHLAGAHGRFAAFVYRLRHTWGTLQAYTQHMSGWLARLVLPLMRWYAPYFNAYSFVLARQNEFQADAASAELVGVDAAAHALKRVNLIAPSHERYMQLTYRRMDDEALPPADMTRGWAMRAVEALPASDSDKWLGLALDRIGDPTDTHPTLRARLLAMAVPAEDLMKAPPALAGPSAATAWLTAALPALRERFQSNWAANVAEPWADGHAKTQQLKQRLAELRASGSADADEQIEHLRLLWRLEPDADHTQAFAMFNATHHDHALGLFLEGQYRLERDDAAGAPLLERAMALDPAATCACCDSLYGHHMQRGDHAAAELYAQRWRDRKQMEALRAAQFENLDRHQRFIAHAQSAEVIGALRNIISDNKLPSVKGVYLVRHVIDADPDAEHLVMGIDMGWWGRKRGHASTVMRRLTAQDDWPVALTFVVLADDHKHLRSSFRKVAGSQIV